jgi:hypothetical protein
MEQRCTVHVLCLLRLLCWSWRAGGDRCGAGCALQSGGEGALRAAFPSCACRGADAGDDRKRADAIFKDAAQAGQGDVPMG